MRVVRGWLTDDVWLEVEGLGVKCVISVQYGYYAGIDVTVLDHCWDESAPVGEGDG